MPVVYLTDTEIDSLVAILKPLPADYRSRLRFRSKSYSNQHEEAQLEVEVTDTGTFRLMIRKNRLNPLDFSVILAFLPPERIRLLRLRRYNGIHDHTNRIEGSHFRDFHVHYATQRYQEIGWAIDKFAEKTDRYKTLDGAIEICLNDCNFLRPEDERRQPRLI